MAILGASDVSHEDVLMSGNNLVVSLGMLGLFDESMRRVRDELLPFARRSLGSDHDITLRLSQSLATNLQTNPESTCRQTCVLKRGVEATRILS